MHINVLTYTSSAEQIFNIFQPVLIQIQILKICSVELVYVRTFMCMFSSQLISPPCVLKFNHCAYMCMLQEF